MSIGAPRLSWMPALLLAVLSMATSAAQAADTPDGRTLVRSYCSGCHTERNGGFERISAIRKTPEGWAMTLFRMHNVHGLALPEDASDAITRYLSDTQGLAPAETVTTRFALERRPNAKDLDLGPELAQMCGRCHSLARVALQRRDADDWVKHMNFHVGQFPSLEYQASGRDRPWWDIASKELPPKLGALFPLHTQAWSDWAARTHRAPTGHWVVTGHEPGGRDLYGTAEVSSDGQGGYTAHYRLRDLAGHEVAGESHALVYTGYEWRGRATLGGRASREVFALSEDGARMTGRWFDPDHSEEGGEWTAVRTDAPAQVLAVLPRSMKAGTSGAVTVVATGIAPGTTVSLGAGVAIKVTSVEDVAIHATASVAPDAATGTRTVTVGAAGTGGAFAVYRKIERIDVEPSYAIARVGGGKVPAVTAQFEALASARDASGAVVPLGPIAAEWSAVPFDAEAARTHDEKFGGTLDAAGRYHPAGAGPNPAREFSGNNTANLKIQARVADGADRVDGDSHLIVTVQRWITTPIY